MKIILYFILLLFCTYDSNKQLDISYIEIKTVGFDILTPIDINCDDFESYFNSDIIVIYITNTKNIQKILHFVCSLKEDTNTNISNVDTRTKLLIHYNNFTTDTICMDSGNLIINNKPYIVTEEFANYIDETCKKERFFNKFLKMLEQIIIGKNKEK
jgi:hypothetical protein